MRNYFLIALLVFIAASSFAQETADGPYVRYRNGEIVVSTIKRYDDLLKVEEQIIDEDKKGGIELNVVPEGHKDWTFSVKLKAAIEMDSSVYVHPSKVLFLSDIEGEFGNFRKILIAAKVIDEKFNWRYGDGSLVIAGDLFDRGKDVVPELWLLYKLEDEAKIAGGHVHVILGNHDIMNLSGDHRYTDAKYFKNAWLLHTDCTGLFGKDTELGRWLRSKNIVEKIGDVLVMHGGLSPEVRDSKLSMEEINQQCRPYYDRQLDDVTENLRAFFNKKTALFWYRGYFMQPRMSEEGVDSTLRQYGCRYILVGHTILKKNIARYYGGKVIGVDVDEHKSLPSAVLYKDGGWWIVDYKGRVRKLKYYLKNDEIRDEDIL